VLGIFKIGTHELFALASFKSRILLVSASKVAKIISMSHKNVVQGNFHSLDNFKSSFPLALYYLYIKGFLKMRINEQNLYRKKLTGFKYYFF
jgi:hypothetical protein